MGSSAVMLDSQENWPSVVSTRSAGSWSQASASLTTAGASNSTEAAEVRAVPACFSATTSRSTPSSWTRSSSTEANRSAGSGAHILATSR